MEFLEEQNYQDYEKATELFYVSIGDGSAGVSVRTGADGRGFVWWTDYVANDAVEVFPTLATALGYFAALVACSEDDWARMIAGNTAKFIGAWSAFEAENLI
jgi:hypothetical protein